MDRYGIKQENEYGDQSVHISRLEILVPIGSIINIGNIGISQIISREVAGIMSMGYHRHMRRLQALVIKRSPIQTSEERMHLDRLDASSGAAETRVGIGV